MVRAPYNYPFSDTLSDAEQREIRQRILSDPSEAVRARAGVLRRHGRGARQGRGPGDIWGASKDVLLYVRPATLRVTANGYAILTRRRDVQRVISEFVGRYGTVVAGYRAQGLYPMNMPVEIRVTGLDDPRDVGVDGAQPALLSALSPRADHPEWDVAVWLDILSFPGTPAADRAYRDIERCVFANYRPPYAMVRPEWSKGWAYTAARRMDAPAEDQSNARVPDAFPKQMGRRRPHPRPARPARRLHESPPARAAARATRMNHPGDSGRVT